MNLFGAHLYYSPRPLNPRQNRLAYALYGQIHMGGRVRFENLKRWFNPRGKPFYLLDMGCGNAHYAVYYARRNPQATILAVDTDADRLSIVKEIVKERNITFRVSGIETLNTAEQYDVILLIDVLEHIEDDRGALIKLSELLKPGGRLFINVPRGKSAIKRYLIGRLEEDGQHVREGYEKEEMLGLVSGIPGLEAVRHKVTFGWPGALAWELDILMIRYCSWLRYMVFPFLLLLARLDGALNPDEGNGIMVECCRE